jgi:hypothetical protein
MNRARLIRQPGQPGTKRLVEQYGPKLVCVRYRYDDKAGKRYKTVELIVEESNYSPSQPKISPETIVGVRVGLQEIAWQRKIKLAGGKWNREQRLWEVRYDRAVALGLEDRIELKERSISRSFGKSPA